MVPVGEVRSMKVSGHILDQPETDLHFVTFSRFAVGGRGGQRTLIAGVKEQWLW